MGFRKRNRRGEPPAEGGSQGLQEEDLLRQFLPAELIRMAGITDTTRHPSSILAEQKEWKAVILNANIAGFQELVRDVEIQEIYRLINRTLSCCIPAIYQNRGIIDRFQEAGAAALFTGDIQDGLNAAILLCEGIAKLGDRDSYRRFGVGLCYGPVMVGVVGFGRRLSVLTLSTYTGLGAFLQGMGSRYYARILAAESYVSQIQDFERNYNSRFLGIIYIRSTGEEEKIYDMFDGDEAAVRNRKRKTKMLFEKGVGFFIRRDFWEARRYFIEVLKADREDRAAREYVFRCDRYLSMAGEEKASADIYIEQY